MESHRGVSAAARPGSLGSATPSLPISVFIGVPVVFLLLVLLPSLSPHYGFYSDELYYIACARRLAFGYVDHPPLFILLLRLQIELFGESLIALRALPAVLGAVTVFLSAWMARRMGGGYFAQALAGLAVLTSPQFIIWFSFFSVNCLEVVLWAAAAWILVERCRSADPRLWVVLGIVLALSFLTKHTTAILVAALVVGTLLSSLRGDLRGPWPWIGAIVALVIISPNVYWQVVNDWPSLDFYHRIAETNLPTSPLEVVFYQVVAQNPASLVVWGAGVWFFLVSQQGRSFRSVGWVFVTLLVIAVIGGQRRPDRIAGIYPVMFAGGAVLLESVRIRNSRRLGKLWNTYTLLFFMLLIGAVATTVALPILPPRLLTHHPLFDGDDDWRQEVGTQKLPYHLGNRTHWKDFVAEVSAVSSSIDPRQRDGTIILADYFGHAGAIEYYGGDALPPVYSQHTGYYLWGPPPQPPSTVISIGVDETLLRTYFEDVELATTFRCEWCPRWQDELPIYVARSPRKPFAEMWVDLGRIGGMDYYHRQLRTVP